MEAVLSVLDEAFLVGVGGVISFISILASRLSGASTERIRALQSDLLIRKRLAMIENNEGPNFSEENKRAGLIIENEDQFKLFVANELAVYELIERTLDEIGSQEGLSNYASSKRSAELMRFGTERFQKEPEKRTNFVKKVFKSANQKISKRLGSWLGGDEDE